MRKNTRKSLSASMKYGITSCEAMVIPGAESVLLGAIALEGMDLMVNPIDRELVGVHGKTEEYLALQATMIK